MSFWINQFHDVHYKDSQRMLEKSRQSRQDIDEWEMSLRVHRPRRMSLGSRLVARIQQLQQYIEEPHPIQSRRIVDSPK